MIEVFNPYDTDYAYIAITKAYELKLLADNYAPYIHIPQKKKAEKMRDIVFKE